MEESQELETSVDETAGDTSVDETAGDTSVDETAETKIEDTGGEKIPHPRQKKQQTAQERIDEVIAKMRTIERREAEKEKEIDYWRNIALSQGTKTPAETQPTLSPSGSPTATPRPKMEQFDTLEQYEEAVVDWKLEQREATRQAAQLTKQRDEDAVRIASQFREKAEKVKAEYPDFDEVIAAPVFTPVMQEIVLAAENGPALAYHLALPENRAVVNKIAKMPPHLQVYELGKFETQITLKRQTKKTTNAPPPINPLSSGTGSGTSGDIDKIKDDADWFAAKRARDLAVLKQRGHK